MEYYGPKPKKFTKEWWPYFWDYYKWQTIAVVCAIVAIVFTIVQVKTQTKYDASFVAAGNAVFPYEYGENLEKALVGVIDDIQNNGEKDLLLEQITFSENDVDAQMMMGMRKKLDIRLTTDENFAYVMDKKLLEQYLTSDQTRDCFMPLESWLLEDVKEENILKVNGVAYAVNLKDSKLLSHIGFNDYEIYAVLKAVYDVDDQDNYAYYENAKKILNKLAEEE